MGTIMTTIAPPVKIGSDFEFFFQGKNYGLPAHLFLHGTKSNPERHPNVNGGFVHWDNAAVEMSVPATYLCEEFIKSVNSALQYAYNIAYCANEDHPNGPEVKITYTDAMNFHEDALLMPELMEIGCDPDLNAWKGGEVRKPDRDIRASEYRVAGVHFHIDFKRSFEDKCKLVQLLDTYIEAPLWPHISRHHPLYMHRRSHYGAAGAFRDKPYGIEWRVPSSNILREPSMFMHIYFESIQEVVANFDALCDIEKHRRRYSKPQDTINHYMERKGVVQYGMVQMKSALAEAEISIPSVDKAADEGEINLLIRGY